MDAGLGCFLCALSASDPLPFVASLACPPETRRRRRVANSVDKAPDKARDRASFPCVHVGTNSSTAISGRQLNRTGYTAHPIPLDMKTRVPRGDIFNPLE